MTQISDIFLQRIARIIRIFRRKRRRWPDAEQSEWQEPPRLKNPYNPCNPLWKNTSEPLARRSQFFMNLIICGFRRIHVIISIKKGNDIAHFGRESLSLLYAFVQRPLGTKPHHVITTRRGCSLQKEGVLLLNPVEIHIERYLYCNRYD